MPECYGHNRISCEDRMCNGLYEFVSNARNCLSGPKYKDTTMALHFLGFLFGLGSITLLFSTVIYDAHCY